MNYLTILLHFLYEPRFSELLERFGVSIKGKESRTNLTNQLLESESFQEDLLLDYLYKAELQNFCKSVHISNSSGTKKQIWERIKLFLKDIDSDAIIISKNEQNNEEIAIVIDNNETLRMRDSLEMFYANALSIVHRFVDYWSYDQNEEKAIKVLKNKHPELTLDDCREAFNYALTAYREAMTLVESNTEIYSDILEKEQGSTKRETKPFEKKFLEKYNKLNEQNLWIFDQIFFWHHLK